MFGGESPTNGVECGGGLLGMTAGRGSYGGRLVFTTGPGIGDDGGNAKVVVGGGSDCGGEAIFATGSPRAGTVAWSVSGLGLGQSDEVVPCA